MTKRPLDFDREEETRKKETNKWLDSHFGSESTSRESLEDSLSGVNIEPTKKIFFNVTIKSGDTAHQSHRPSTLNKIPMTANHGSTHNIFNNKLSSPSKVFVPERDFRESTPVKSSTQSKTKYFQGISDWSERKNSKPQKICNSLVSHLTPKSFQEELIGTLEKKQRMLKQRKVIFIYF